MVTVNNGIEIVECSGIFQDPDGTFWAMDTRNTAISGAMNPNGPFMETDDWEENDGQEWYRLALRSGWVFEPFV